MITWQKQARRGKRKNEKENKQTRASIIEIGNWSKERGKKIWAKKARGPITGDLQKGKWKVSQTLVQKHDLSLLLSNKL